MVTGGAGFIGSHLCERLLRDGHQLSIVDELNDFYSPALKLKNLGCLRSTGNVAFYQSDISEEGAMTDVFEESRPDLVIHLAARAGVRPSLEQPLLYERVNVRGTLVLLEACRQFDVKQFIFASSSSVYGGRIECRFARTTRLTGPYRLMPPPKLRVKTFAIRMDSCMGFGWFVSGSLQFMDPGSGPILLSASLRS